MYTMLHVIDGEPPSKKLKTTQGEKAKFRLL